MLRGLWDRPCCHPIWPVLPTPHVTQIHGFVPQPRCLNALYIGRGRQWIQLQAMECHCLLLLDKQHQTQTGLCEPNTIVYWVYCGVFSLLVRQPVAGQNRGQTHTVATDTSFLRVWGLFVTRDTVPVLKQRGPKLKRWVTSDDVFNLWCSTW